MRMLMVMSGHHRLEKCGEWFMVEQFVRANCDRGYFYIVVPERSVITSGSIPNTTILRSNTDMSYHFMRDIGSIVNINDGQSIIDVAVVMTPQLAAGLDLAMNAQEFTRNIFNVPIVIWQQMVWAFKWPRWFRACMGYDNLFLSADEMRRYSKIAIKDFKPSFVRNHLDNDCGVVTYGVRVNDVVEISDKTPKRDKLTVIFGGRMNEVHRPDINAEIMKRVYELGYEFELIVTTPDKLVPSFISDLVEMVGGTLISDCGQDQFFAQICTAHIALVAGLAGTATYAYEYFAARCLVVAQDTQWTDEIAADVPSYPFVYDTVESGVSKMVDAIKNFDSIREEHDSEELISRIKNADLSIKQRETFDWFASRATSHARRERGGIKGTRTRMITQLASVGGEATLSQMEKVTAVSGTIVRKESVGRWVTRKLIHDMLVSSPAVTDMCDAEDPRYVLDFEKYRELCDTFDIPFTGPGQVKKVLGVPNA